MGKFAPGNTKAAKLSNEDVYEMRRRYVEENPPWTQAALSRHYQMSINSVGRIVRGESRQSVPMTIDESAVAASLSRLDRLASPGLARLNELMATSVAVKTMKNLKELANWDSRAAKFGATPPEGEEDE